MKDDVYNQFVLLNQLHRIRSAKVGSCDTLLKQIKSSKVTGSNYQISISLAQQLISYKFNSHLIYKLALSKMQNKKAIAPIPRKLLINFRLASFKISSVSTVINFFHDLLLVFRSFILLAKNLFGSRSRKLGDLIREKKSEGYTVVMLNPSFPKGDIYSEELEFNFINWHRKKLATKVCYIHFNEDYADTEIVFKNSKVSIIYAKKLEFNVNFNLLFKLFKNCILVFIRGGNKVPGKFFSILKIIDQVVLAEKIKMTTKDRLPEVIVFGDNHGVLQPYWTYSLQEKNVQIHYYFFSSYDSPIVVKNEDPRIDFWKLNSWPKIYCVDDYQARFIDSHKVSSKQQVIISGFPDFSDYPIQLDYLDRRFKMAVFDYEPILGHFGYSSINDCGYHTFLSNQLFIGLLYEMAKDLNIVMMHKPKRLYLDGQRDRNYSKYLKTLDTTFYRSIDPRVSPRRIIGWSDITISKPITSTAFIAKEELKKSIFFDPIGKVSQNDPALRDLTLFSNINDLSEYIKNQVLLKQSGR